MSYLVITCLLHETVNSLEARITTDSPGKAGGQCTSGEWYTDELDWIWGGDAADRLVLLPALIGLGCSNELRAQSSCQVGSQDLGVSVQTPGDRRLLEVAAESLKAAGRRGQGGRLGQCICLGPR